METVIADRLSRPHELLQHASMARLACNGLDGLPRVIPIGIYWTGDEIVMSTAATAPKVTALSARPEVALTIDAGDSPGSAKTLSVRGVAHLTIVDGVVPESTYRRKAGAGHAPIPVAVRSSTVRCCPVHARTSNTPVLAWRNAQGPGHPVPLR